jgi:hypothetical protein
LLSSPAVSPRINGPRIGLFAHCLFFGLVLSVAQEGGSRASETSTFLIAAASGYGVEDCLGEGGECGKLVADAWCEAHGRGAALNFGRSENDYDARPQEVDPARYFITCGD